MRTYGIKCTRKRLYGGKSLHRPQNRRFCLFFYCGKSAKKNLLRFWGQVCYARLILDLGGLSTYIYNAYPSRVWYEANLKLVFSMCSISYWERKNIYIDGGDREVNK